MEVTFKVPPCYVAVCWNDEYGWFVLTKYSSSGLSGHDYGTDALGIPNPIGWSRHYVFRKINSDHALYFESEEKAKECVQMLKEKVKTLFLHRNRNEVKIIPYNEFFKLCLTHPCYPPYPLVEYIVGGGIGKNRVGNYKGF